MSNSPQRLTMRRHVSELKSPGDYARVSNGVVLSCPFCGQLMACTHKVVSEDPISIEPSIVGPGLDQFVKHCGHHFFVRNGEVVVA